MMDDTTRLKYLLFQIRNSDDPMRDHEVQCFAQHLGCSVQQINVHDLIAGPPPEIKIANTDAVLIGGSGDYSVVTGGVWLDDALQTMVQLVEQSVPTFASCWGFQALARALGGKVVNDLGRAEIGSLEIRLTDSGQLDPLFSSLGESFTAQMGHEDIVDEIPDQAVLLASTDRVRCQAFTFPGKLIYATQFHPELAMDDLITRLKTYPQYVQKISGLPFDEFVKTCRPTPQTNQLLTRFAQSLARQLA